MKLNIITIIMYLILTFTLTATTYELGTRYGKNEAYNGCMDSYLTEQNELTLINSKGIRFLMNDETVAKGFYRTNSYFCVITNNRPMNEIAETTFHELTHVYNEKEKQHFEKDFDLKKEVLI